MMRFLVISYDDDQQVWHYDVTEDATEEDAEARICRIRPYVIAAEALTADQLRVAARLVGEGTSETIREELARIEVESNARA
jgi:hypothetical protein